MATHDEDLARAFDRQAAAFERARVMSDGAALARLVAFAALPPGARVLDAGCGPGLVAEAFLDAGCEVVGVDLSAEMIRRARERCARFGDRARFEQRALSDLAPPALGAGLDAAVSRNVLHHVEDPLAFVRRQAALVRPGGVVVAHDLAADPDPAAAAWATAVERGRDRTHVRTLSPGELVDLLARAGLRDVRLEEEDLRLDFDEWFDRGSPSLPKEEVRALLLSGTSRGFAPSPREGGAVELRCVRAMVRGVKG